MRKNRWYNQDGTETPTYESCQDLVDAGVTNQDMAILCTACTGEYGSLPEENQHLCECCADDQQLINWGDAFGSLNPYDDETPVSTETYIQAMTDTKDCWRCDGENVVWDTYEYERGTDFVCPEGSSGSMLAPGHNPCANPDVDLEPINGEVTDTGVDTGMMAGLGDKKILIYIGLAGLAWYLYTQANKGGAMKGVKA